MERGSGPDCGGDGPNPALGEIPLPWGVRGGVVAFPPARVGQLFGVTLVAMVRAR